MKIKQFLFVSTALATLAVGQVTYATTEDSVEPKSTTTSSSESLEKPLNSIAKEQTPFVIRPVFNVKGIAANVGAKGTIKVTAIDKVSDNSGTFKASVKDPNIISIDKDGNWLALKAGTTTIVLEYTYSDAALKEIQTVYPNYELTKNETPQEIYVEVKDLEKAKQKMDITPEFIDTELTSLMVKDTGIIKVKAIEGIAVTGKFTAFNDKDGKITMDENGKWTALKVGSTHIPLTFAYSEETYAALEKKFPNTEFISKAIAQSAPVIIFDGIINYQLKFTPNEITAKVGETGKIKIEPIGGVDNLTADFNVTDNQGIIEVDNEGNWKALKVGETSLTMAATLTEESLKRIKEQTPHKMTGPTPEIATLILVKVTEDTSGSTTPKPKTLSNKVLPKTGETSTLSYSLAGGSLLLVSLILVKKRKDD